MQSDQACSNLCARCLAAISTSAESQPAGESSRARLPAASSTAPPAAESERSVRRLRRILRRLNWKVPFSNGNPPFFEPKQGELRPFALDCTEMQQRASGFFLVILSPRRSAIIEI